MFIFLVDRPSQKTGDSAAPCDAGLCGCDHPRDCIVAVATTRNVFTAIARAGQAEIGGNELLQFRLSKAFAGRIIECRCFCFSPGKSLTKYRARVFPGAAFNQTEDTM